MAGFAPQSLARVLEGELMDFQGKKIAILGERDGVPGHTIEQAIEGLGAEVVYSTTQCFV